MTRLCVGLALVLGVASLHAQKTRWGQEMPFAKRGVDYPITVHVHGVHLRPDCSDEGCFYTLFADVVSNAQKLELGCPIDNPKKKGIPLSLGDVRARVLKNASGLKFGDGYELLLPGNRVFRCSVSGMVE